MKTEVWYQWKELIEGRLINVEADPMVHENSDGDLLFTSEEEARQHLVDRESEQNDWILVRTTFEPMVATNV